MTAGIRVAGSSDRERAIDAIVLAFSADPIARWSWPDPHVYLRTFPAFVQAFGGRAIGDGTAYIAEPCAGAALWLAPGVEPDDERMMALLQDTVAPAKLQDVHALLEQMAGYHPKEPHWYLPLMGVDPALQGTGHGAALLRHALGVCDADGRPAYLESTNPKNVPLYQRHGFELLGTIEAGTSPPLFPMVRRPR